jgi:peptidoglycan/xylan/chitin deacetylase (PgdA/CDA1 family)
MRLPLLGALVLATAGAAYGSQAPQGPTHTVTFVGDHDGLRHAEQRAGGARRRLLAPRGAYVNGNLGKHQRLRDAVRRKSHCDLVLPAGLPSRSVVVPILMYHRINLVTPSTPAASRGLTVHPADFARQMSWLARHGYRTVTQRELFEALMCGLPLGRRAIMITFDDGYRDVFFRASPILMRHGMGATAYVVSGRISGDDPSFLTWPLIRELERRGIEIGSHTVAHRFLPSLSDAEMLDDLTSSRRTLEHRLDHRVPWLAYPFGGYDSRVEALSRRAGYLLAVTTRPGAVHAAGQPLALRRLRILDSTGVAGLASMLAATSTARVAD